MATEPDRAPLAPASPRDDFHLALLESVEAPVLALDEDLVVLFANPAYARLLGSQPAELLGRRLDELGADPALTGSLESYRQVLADGQTAGFEGAVADRYLAVRISRTPYGVVA